MLLILLGCVFTGVMGDTLVPITVYNITATEGYAFSNKPVAKFNGTETVAQYAAIIYPGDSTGAYSTANASSILSISGNSASGFTVLFSYTYLEELSTTFTLIVSDVAGSSFLLEGTALISDASLSSAYFDLPAFVENTPTPVGQTLLKFIDNGGFGLELPDVDVTCTVDWGDGNVNACNVVRGSTNGAYSAVVATPHLYVGADEGSLFTITVTIGNEDDNQVITSTDITILDSSITNVQLFPPFAALEGDVILPFVVATFTDNGTFEFGEYNATINWGDGETDFVTAASSFVGLANNVVQVFSPTHTYLEEGVYNVTVTISHEITVTSLGVSSITVLDQKIQSLELASTFPFTGVVEGTPIPPSTVLATFVDPGFIPGKSNETYLVTINWGDGVVHSANKTLTVLQIAAPHNYTENGNFTVTISVSDEANTLTVTGVIQVADAPLANLTVFAPTNLVEGVPTPLNFIIADFADEGTSMPTSADVNETTASILWGDGSESPGVIQATANGFQVIAPQHNYSEEGNFTIGVMVLHNLQLPLVGSIDVVVADADLVSYSYYDIGTVFGTEGFAGNFTGAIVVNFTDPAGFDNKTSEYSAIINWGDGSTSTGNITALGNGMYAVSAPFHEFDEYLVGASGITVTIFHGTADPLTVPIGNNAVQDFMITGSGSVVPGVFPLIGREGTAVNISSAVLTFHDALPEISEYTAVFDFGDGQAGLGTFTNVGTNISVFMPPHIYNQDGVFLVTVTVTHEQTSLTTTGAIVLGNITISDVGIANFVAASSIVVESGTPSGPLFLGTFEDPGGGVPFNNAFYVDNDYNSSIDFKDGTPVLVGALFFQPTPECNASICVIEVWAPSHTFYFDPAVIITIQDTSGSVPLLGNIIVTVLDAPITNLTVITTSQPVFEGNATGPIIIASFFDPGSNPSSPSPSDNYTVTINWGDGSALDTNANASFLIVVNNVSFYTVIADGHTFVEEGVYPVTVSVVHNSLPAVNATGDLLVQEQNITNLVAGAGFPIASFVEGRVNGPIATFATFIDPAGFGNETSNDYQAFISWGDGTLPSVGKVSKTGTPFLFSITSPTHIFAEEGTYNVVVNVTHGADPPISALIGSITVIDANLTGLSVISFIATKGEPTPDGLAIASFLDQGFSLYDGIVLNDNITIDGDESPSDFNATINWGDGTTQIVNVSFVDLTAMGAAYVVLAPPHTYANDGNFTITVTVDHETTPTLVATSTIVVESLSCGVSCTFGFNGAFIESSWTQTLVGDASISTAGAPNTVAIVGCGVADTGKFVPTEFSIGITSAGVITFQWSYSTADTSPLFDPFGYDISNSLASFVKLTNDTGALVQSGEVTVPVFVGNTFSFAVLSTGCTGGAATVTISNFQFCPDSAVSIVSAIEGSPFFGDVLHFNDPTTLTQSISNYIATVQLGDPNNASPVVLTSVESPFGQIVANSAGGYDVFLRYIYSDELTNTEAAVVVTVTIVDGSATCQTGLPLNVTDAALVGGACSTTQQGIENSVNTSSTSTNIDCTFSDKNPLAAPSDFNAVVNWGDGLTSSVVPVNTTVTIANCIQNGINIVANAATPCAFPWSFIPAVRSDVSCVSNGIAFDADGGADDNVTQLLATITGQLYVVQVTVAATQPSGDVHVVLGGVPVINNSGVSGTFTVFYEATSTSTLLSIGGNSFNGTNTVTGISVQACNSLFTIVTDHQYIDEGNFSIFVSVTDNGGATPITLTDAADVAEASILLNPISYEYPSNVNESSTLPAFANFATFTDYGGVESVLDYVVTIAWGDGSSNVVTPIVDGANSFVINAPAHTYEDEGTYVVNLTVQHETVAVQFKTHTVNVFNPQLTSFSVQSPFDTTFFEGVPTGFLVDVATFTDPAGSTFENVAQDYNCTINWGDGSAISQGLVFVLGNPSNGQFQVNAPSHTYAEEGNYTVVVSIQHENLTPLPTQSFKVVVLDSQLTRLTVFPFDAAEGALTPNITGIATFIDVGGPELDYGAYNSMINWGDGHYSPGTIVTTVGSTLIRVDVEGHKYAEEGPYNVTVTVVHDLLPAVSATTEVVVSDPPVIIYPVASILQVSLTTPQVIATFIDPGSNETAADYAAIIDWGDGSLLTPGTVTGPDGNGVYNVTAFHSYDDRKREERCAARKPFEIKITVVQDPTGGAAVASSAFTFATCPDRATFATTSGSFCSGQTYISTPPCPAGGGDDDDESKLAASGTVEFSRTVIDGDAFCGTGFQLSIDGKIRIDTAKFRRLDGYFRDDDRGTSSFLSQLKFHDHNLVLTSGAHNFTFTSTADGCHDGNMPLDVSLVAITFATN